MFISYEKEKIVMIEEIIQATFQAKLEIQCLYKDIPLICLPIATGRVVLQNSVMVEKFLSSHGIDYPAAQTYFQPFSGVV